MYQFIIYLQIVSINEELSIRLSSLLNLENDNNVIGRLSIYSTNLDLVSNNFFGIGFGRNNREIMNEHNLYFFIALGTGIVGLILFLNILLILSKIFVKSIKRTSKFSRMVVIGSFGSLISLVINGLTANVISTHYVVISTFLCISLGLAAVNSNYKSHYYYY